MQKRKWFAGRMDKVEDFNSVACFLTLDLENVLLSHIYKNISNIWARVG